MAACTLMVSRPGAYSQEGLILGNPEVAVRDQAPTGSYVIALAFDVGNKHRLLSVVTDVAIDVVQLSATETISSFTGVATPIPSPFSGNVSYACLVHPATVGVYIKTA